MSDPILFDPVPVLAKELSLSEERVAAVVTLLSEGNTVPFIARYRKELSGGMDEVQIRSIEERRAYLLELEERRQTILSSIEEQGKLTDELRAQIHKATTKAGLEDLYLPYKPKRRTRATAAREKGLEPLAKRILEQPDDGDPAAEAVAFIDTEKGVETADDALAGARDIAAEVTAEKVEVRTYVRKVYAEQGVVVSKVVPKKAEEPTKFEQYYDFQEAAKDIPAHRFLAIRRGESEGVLRARIEVDGEAIVNGIEALMNVRVETPFGAVLREAVADSYKRLLSPSVVNDVRVELKMRSDRTAVDVFADNVRNLLMAAPLGTKSIIGIDPGLRTGCKCAAVSDTGKFLDHTTIFLVRKDKEGALDKAKKKLLEFVAKHNPVGIAIGNGTGGRETEAFVRKTLADKVKDGLFVILVSEAGASVYSASDVARDEFPDLDLTIRGAISIARRLQDPLAELVKIEPKAIGVGQYQHDVHQPTLQKKLSEVVESCVNRVGVELNTASAPLLSYVAGIGKSVAKKIVAHREERGAFRSRKQLLDVSGLGPRAFQQAAGFLRIRNGEEVLDRSAVHPERYDLVFQIAADLGVKLDELAGNSALLEQIDIGKYVGDGVGEPTLRDIVQELEKPGRDPRDTFEPPKFRDDVNTLEDLKQGMQLDGVVTNVTAFGAFVDVGVHQDGLVHVSQLADRFVKDPSEVVKVGDRIKVRVLDVDLARKRIALTARSESGPRERSRPRGRDDSGGRDSRGERKGRGGRRGDGKSRDKQRSGGDGRPRNNDGGGRGRGGARRSDQASRGGERRGRNDRGRRDDRRSGDGRRDNRQSANRFSHNPFAKLADLDKK